MQISRYNVTATDAPGKGSVLLYNTLGQSLVELDPDWRRTYEGLARGLPAAGFDPEHIQGLQDQGFLVATREEENARLANWLRLTAYENDGIYRATIVTTMACNLACAYCIENGTKNARAMTLDTAGRAFDWITAQASHIPTRRLAIAFYGGEPLLNLEVVRSLSQRFQAWGRERDIGYGFTLSTNGTLLTRQLVKELLPLGLGLAQVSIDGRAEVHDRRRPFAAGKGSSFAVIMANLEAIADLVRVNLVGTYAEGAEDEVIAFLDELADRGLLQRMSSVVFEPESPYRDSQGRTCHRTGGCDLEPDRDITGWLRLRRAMLERGTGLERPLLAASSCSLLLAHGHVIIEPDGAISKCHPLIGDPAYALGSLDQEELGPRHHDFMTREPWRACLEQTDCPHVPLCGVAAGCRFRALLRDGDLWSLACQRSYFDRALPELMQLEHRRLALLGAAREAEMPGQQQENALAWPAVSGA